MYSIAALLRAPDHSSPLGAHIFFHEASCQNSLPKYENCLLLASQSSEVSQVTADSSTIMRSIEARWLPSGLFHLRVGLAAPVPMQGA